MVNADLFGYEPPATTALPSGGRLSACRECGKGYHRNSEEMFAGGFVREWVCCDECPHKAELNPELP